MIENYHTGSEIQKILGGPLCPQKHSLDWAQPQTGQEQLAWLLAQCEGRCLSGCCKEQYYEQVQLLWGTNVFMAFTRVTRLVSYT